METFWVRMHHSDESRSRSGHLSESQFSERCMDASTGDGTLGELVESETIIVNQSTDKMNRLVSWNVEILARLLKGVLTRRNNAGALSKKASKKWLTPLRNPENDKASTGTIVMDEVKEIILLPEFDAATAQRAHAEMSESVELPEALAIELRDYVMTISSLYRENPFHNFEHASHVAMSVVKLLSRIVSPSDIEVVIGDRGTNEEELQAEYAKTLHNLTYGITSDPLTHFACVFSALIHDVDHAGVPNTDLLKEKPALGRMYKNKSVAEQNSVDIAWELLMTDSFTNLRAAIYQTDTEKAHFRQLVVNVVMATDIMDKDLKAQRDARWDRAFLVVDAHVSARDTINRKATIVLEHLIQASDVAHTMQHWHVYRSWNEKLYFEHYLAFQAGRSENDPSKDWYSSEIGFFDFYIIPLAKKLKDCGVFGVSSDEYLNYATKNRQEWEISGRELVAAMIQKTNKLYENMSITTYATGSPTASSVSATEVDEMDDIMHKLTRRPKAAFASIESA
jgi:3'5'-cyclic nucleotide phosphodiesterase